MELRYYLNVKRKPSSPSSLYEQCLAFVAHNAVHIDSLENFPEQIARQILKTIVMSGKLTENSFTFNEQVKIWKTFVQAYRNQLLNSLNLENGLLVINEYQEPLLELFMHLTELNMKNCYLGPAHEVIQKIGRLRNLKRLNLSNNRLNDTSIKWLARCVRFGHGSQELKELDLSENKITDDSLKSLKAFEKLQFLDLTGTEVSDKAFKILAEELNMYPCKETEYPIEPIETEGWATDVIVRWREILEERRKRRARPLGKYAMCRGYKVYVRPIEEKKPIICDVLKIRQLFKKGETKFNVCQKDCEKVGQNNEKVKKVNYLNEIQNIYSQYTRIST